MQVMAGDFYRQCTAVDVRRVQRKALIAFIYPNRCTLLADPCVSWSDHLHNVSRLHINVHSANLALSTLLLFRNHISRNAIRRLVDQHQHRSKRHGHQRKSNAEPNKRTGFDLRIHPIRDSLADGFEAAKCSSVANVC